MKINDFWNRVLVNYIFPTPQKTESWFPDIYDDAAERAKNCYVSSNTLKPKILSKSNYENKEREY